MERKILEGGDLNLSGKKQTAADKLAGILEKHGSEWADQGEEVEALVNTIIEDSIMDKKITLKDSSGILENNLIQILSGEKIFIVEAAIILAELHSKAAGPIIVEKLHSPFVSYSDQYEILLSALMKLDKEECKTILMDMQLHRENYGEIFEDDIQMYLDDLQSN